MKLLFDVSATQPNSSGKRHGGGRYGEIILFRMIERKLKFACFYDSSTGHRTKRIKRYIE